MLTNMKTLRLLAGILGCAVALTGCDRMLEFEPGDVILAEDAINNADDLQRRLRSTCARRSPRPLRPCWRAAGEAKFEVWLARRKRSKFEALLLAGAPQAKRNLRPCRRAAGEANFEVSLARRRQSKASSEL